MKNFKFATAFFLLTASLALQAHDHAHKGHHQKKHAHGDVELELAYEGKDLEFKIEGPAESFLGFEYAPKTDAEKKLFNDAKTLLTTNLLSKILILPNDLKCSVAKVDFEQEIESHDQEKDHAKKHKHAGEHSEIQVEGKISCNETLDKKTLQIALIENFKKIKSLEIEIVGNQMKKLTSKKARELIQL